MGRKFSPFHKSLSGWHTLFLALLVAISVSVYVLSGVATYRLGFPLDDSWIHQTYARNFGLTGEWAFSPGLKSAGSTAPLWSLLLAVGYWLKISPYVWAFGLGSLCLWGLAVFAERAFRQLVPSYKGLLPWVGMFIALEWHLVWAAASGMETILFAFLVTITLGLLMLGWRKSYLLYGLLIGLSIWLRPDGVTLLFPLAVSIFFSRESGKVKVRSIAYLLIGFILVFAFYLLFNLWLTGTPMPNTFYAKQTEYAILQARPLILRILDQLQQPLIGAGALLLPGGLWFIFHSMRKCAWNNLLLLAWFLGYAILYALRLPVTYQHGRYFMPAMPVFYLWGFIGTLTFLGSEIRENLRRVLDISWRLSITVVLLIFWLLGAQTYAEDVVIIESEMVEVAHWVLENVPEDQLIAVHDIGALGYFAPRQMLDLAGLISPEVIPFLRDEITLANFLDQKGAVYLITFPSWYPLLAQKSREIYSTPGRFSVEQGGEKMIVYRWRGNLQQPP